MTIHTIGDSHSYFGWSGVTPHHIGPVLCYSFGKDPLQRCDILSFGIQEGDTLIFCFGEIDCRCHVHKHVSPTLSYQTIISQLVHNYIEAIKTVIATLNIKLKRICVYNVVPPVQRYNTIENPQYPYLGTDEQRKQYVLYFNQELQKKCKENNFVFVNVYDKYTDIYGFLRKDLSDGNVHIRNGIHLTNFIKTFLN